jgi:hypothetical protein
MIIANSGNSEESNMRYPHVFHRWEKNERKGIIRDDEEKL